MSEDGVEERFGEFLAGVECAFFDAEAAFAAGAGSGDAVVDGEVAAEYEDVDGLPAGLFEQLVGFAAACAAFVFDLLHAGAFFDDSYGGVTEADESGFDLVLIGLVAAGRYPADPPVAAVVLDEAEPLLEIEGEGFGVPVDFVEDAFTVGVFVGGFVRDDDELAGPFLVEEHSIWRRSGNESPLAGVVGLEPFAGALLDADRDSFAVDHFPVDFEGGETVFAGGDGCCDDVLEVPAACEMLEEVGALSPAGGMGDVPVEPFDAVAVPAQRPGYVGLFFCDVEDVDGFANLLEHLGRVREQLDGGDVFDVAPDGDVLLYGCFSDVGHGCVGLH